MYTCSSLNSITCMRRPMALFCGTRQAHLLSFLLLLSSICCLTKGGPILKLQETSKRVEEMLTVGVAMIGSRPPRCQGRCLSCGQCEAIQVSAARQEEEKSGTRRFSPSAIISASGAGKGSTIYKPLSWKCKCGRIVLNP